MRSNIFDTLERSLANKTTSSADDSVGIAERLRPQTMHGGRGLGRLFGGGMTGHGHQHGSGGCGSHETSTQSDHRTEGDHEEKSKTDEALAILRERYASGEIDEEEFERRLETLRTMRL
ncbi:MAG: SHOCT domain-containing protein [Halobacteriales archaeon]